MEANKSKSRLSYITPLIVFIVICGFLAIGLTLNPRDLPSTLINKTAPNFNLPLLIDDQASFVPQEMLGQKWLLNIWASWCVGCRVEHPLLNQLATQTNIAMVGLNYKDKRSDALNWLQQRGNPYSKIPVDSSGDVGIDYGVYGVPETYVIDENGNIIFKHTGPLTADAVNNNILPLFKYKQ